MNNNTIMIVFGLVMTIASLIMFFNKSIWWKMHLYSKRMDGHKRDDLERTFEWDLGMNIRGAFFLIFGLIVTFTSAPS